MQASGSRDAEGASDDDIDRNVFAPILRRSMLWTPERQATSAWIEHVPFAFWLVDVLRPQRVVELGTHNGVSYSAMCQAAKALGLATSCFAIDTWKGDEHAGFYEESVYRDFSAFHDWHYGAFSRLVRSTFDEALRHFENGSIDLLHIDGLHAYEAVQHDYQSWLPKLTANAVVLFHDTNVREKDFGVFRFWSELTAGKPHFGFLHGHGLGVLGQGRDYPEALRLLFDMNKDGRSASLIREIFGALGRSVRALSERPGLDHSLSEHISEIGRLREVIGAYDDWVANLKRGYAERGSEIDRLGEVIGAYEVEVANLKQRFADRGHEIDVLRDALAARDARLHLSDVTISALHTSMSWRITAPLRAVKHLLAKSC